MSLRDNNNFGVLKTYQETSSSHYSFSSLSALLPQAYGNIYKLYTPYVIESPQLPPVQIITPHTSNHPSASLRLFLVKGISNGIIQTTEIGEEWADQVELKCYQREFDDKDVWVLPSSDAIEDSEGQIIPGTYLMYFEIEDNIYYTELFSFCSNEEDLIRLEWWDNDTLDDGVNQYFWGDRGSGYYKERLFIDSTISLPEYKYEEEGVERDMRFFFQKRLSKKVYNFTFIAPEFLCDAIRYVRMADHVVIRWKGLTYNVTNLEITFEWLELGYLASVKVQFETNTIIKKI